MLWKFIRTTLLAPPNHEDLFSCRRGVEFPADAQSIEWSTGLVTTLPFIGTKGGNNPVGDILLFVEGGYLNDVARTSTLCSTCLLDQT